jgi:small-conductance mechanosensitive channel
MKLGNNWDNLLFAIVVMVVAIVVGRILRFIIGRFVKGASRKLKVGDPTKYNFLKNAVEFIVYIVAVIVIFRSIPQLESYGTALFASAGVIAAIVGFASQSAFSNIISGIFLVIFKPFRVGDRVRVGAIYQGDVEDITLRHTIIKDFENRRIVIPNSVMSNETIINSTLADENLCIFVEIGISFDSDVTKAMQIMESEALLHPLCQDNRTAEEKTNDQPQVDVRLLNFTESGQLLRAYVWARDPTEGFNMKCDLHKSIKERFDREGVSIAYPQRMVYLKESSLQVKSQ